jgi:hypothetical protein
MGLLGPPFALIAWLVLNKEGVLVPLVPCLEPTLGWCSPWTDGVHVTLGFTSTTTVRMISCDLLAHDRIL